MSRQAVFSSQRCAPVAHRAESGDVYAWLRDDNWNAVLGDPSRLASSIANHLRAENAYTDEVLCSPLAGLRERILTEITSRLDPSEKSVPVLDGPYGYYFRYAPDREYCVHARTDRAYAFDQTPPETVLVDGNALAGEGYFSFGEVRHSPDHRCVAYTVDRTGSEYHRLSILDISEGSTIDVRVDDAAGEIAWGATSEYLYWVRRDANGRPSAVMRWHRKDGQSECVYTENDPGYFVSLDRTLRGGFVVITSADHTSSECHILSAGDEYARPEVVLPRRSGVEYVLEECADGFILLTNADGAEDFKLVMLCQDGATIDLVPHRAGCLIEDFAVYAGYLVRLQRESARLCVIVRDLSDQAEHRVVLGDEAFDICIESGAEYDTHQVRLRYSSPIWPRTVADYDMLRRSGVVRRSPATHWGHDPDAYVTERIEAVASDGALIPVTVTRRRTTPVDGSAPVLLYGYGGYGITIPDMFGSDVISLIDRGFMYANAHVRGSKARGYRWYRDGKLASKVNSFTDYVAVGRHLVEAGYGCAGRIVALGRSAGGLLVGASVNIAPELFAAVIASVPFVDVLNTMLDADLPLTPPEWPEWGNPVSSESDREVILGYCPYQNVRERRYPPILATGSVSDSRVGYWESAKWIAKLRHEASRGGPYFLQMNMSAGHGGQSGRYRRLEETATEYAFALASVGQVEA